MAQILTGTFEAVSGVSRLAFALERTLGVFADCLIVADGLCELTLVDI